MLKVANSNVFLKLNYKECIPEHWPAPASDRSTLNLDKEALVADCILLVHEYIIIAFSWYMKILLLHPLGLKYIINASYKFEKILLQYPPGKNTLLWHPPGSKWILFLQNNHFDLSCNQTFGHVYDYRMHIFSKNVCF